MSATLIKSLTTVKIDGKWHIKANCCESNCYPHTYSTYTWPNGYDSREELDGRLLSDFYLGNIRGGSNYSLYIREHVAELAHSEVFDRYVKIRKLHDKLFDYTLDKRYTDEWPTIKDRCERIRLRINQWESEIYAKLGRDFRNWTPDKRRFKVRVNGGYLNSIGKYGYKYTYSDWGKTFSAIQATEFCNDHKNKNPELVAA